MESTVLDKQLNSLETKPLPKKEHKLLRILEQIVDLYFQEYAKLTDIESKKITDSENTDNPFYVPINHRELKMAVNKGVSDGECTPVERHTVSGWITALLNSDYIQLDSRTLNKQMMPTNSTKYYIRIRLIGAKLKELRKRLEE